MPTYYVTFTKKETFQAELEFESDEEFQKFLLDDSNLDKLVKDEDTYHEVFPWYPDNSIMVEDGKGCARYLELNNNVKTHFGIY